MDTYSSTWMNKIKSIASNIISNIKIRPRICIGPFPIKNVEDNGGDPTSSVMASDKLTGSNTEDIVYPYISSESWKPPSTHGLENSPRIIPAYYLSTYMNQDTNILKIDYKYTILDDVRNLRQLSKYQIKYIKNMSSEDKQKIIEEYNRVIEFFLSTLSQEN